MIEAPLNLTGRPEMIRGHGRLPPSWNLAAGKYYLDFLGVLPGWGSSTATLTVTITR